MDDILTTPYKVTVPEYGRWNHNVGLLCMSLWPRDVLVVTRVRKLSGRCAGEFRVWTERHLSHLTHSRTFWCGVILMVKDGLCGVVGATSGTRFPEVLGNNPANA